MKAYLRCMLLGGGMFALLSVPFMLHLTYSQAGMIQKDAIVYLLTSVALFLGVFPLVGALADRLLRPKV